MCSWFAWVILCFRVYTTHGNAAFFTYPGKMNFSQTEFGKRDETVGVGKKTSHSFETSEAYFQLEVQGKIGSNDLKHSLQLYDISLHTSDPQYESPA